MSERPTLTIAVKCPTCGGTKQTMRLVVGDAGINLVRSMPCPNCTDGTIRQAVSCGSGCRHFRALGGSLIFGACTADADMENAAGGRYVNRDWGCLSWEAKA